MTSPISRTGEVGDAAPGHRRQADHAAHRAVPYFVGQEPHARSAGGLSAVGRSQDGAVAHIYEEYRKELRKANALDFDDLLLEAVRLLKPSRRSAKTTTAATSTS